MSQERLLDMDEDDAPAIDPEMRRLETERATLAKVDAMFDADINPLTGEPFTEQYLQIKSQWKSLPAQKPEKRREFLKLFGSHDCVLLCADTGAGKSTQIPKQIIYWYVAQGRKPRIVCTQPRRAASKGLATRVAQELDVTLGDHVGYQYRGESDAHQHTMLRYVTDGLIMKTLLQDGFTSEQDESVDFDCCIIDEAHERSVNIDLILYSLRRLSREDGRRMKIVIMSATIDTGLFEHYWLDGSDKSTLGKIDIEGRAYPVKAHWHDTTKKTLERNMVQVISDIAAGNEPGDVLVFLPVKAMILSLHAALHREFTRRSIGSCEIMNLYSGLPWKLVQQAMNPIPNRRKIVLSTNVAETSITIAGVVFIVDSGLEMSRTYRPKEHAFEIKVGYCSQANVLQRRGRAGRTQPGVCHHMYSKRTFDAMPRYSRPQIEKQDLTGLYLTLSHVAPDMTSANATLDRLIQPPDQMFRKAAEDRLWWYGAIRNESNHRVVWTETMSLLRTFPIKPSASQMLIASYHYRILAYGCAFAALLDTIDTVQQLFLPDTNRKSSSRFPPVWRQCRHATGDHLTLLQVYITYRSQPNDGMEWCRENRLRYSLLREVKDVHTQLKVICEGVGWSKDRPSINLLTGGAVSSDVVKIDDRATIPLLKCLTHALSHQTVSMQNKRLVLDSDPQETYVRPERFTAVAIDKCQPCCYSELVIRYDKRILNMLSSGVKQEWIEYLKRRAKERQFSKK